MFLNRHRRRIRADWPPPIDAFQEHRKLRAAQRYRTLFSLRPDETAAFQTLSKQTQSVAIPPQQLDQVAPPPAKHENMPRVRLFIQHSLRHRAQPSEATPHVGDAGGDPDVGPA